MALHRLHGYPLYVIRGYFLEEEWGGEREWDYEDSHIIVKLPNGNYMDSDGEQTEETLKSNAGFMNKVERIEFIPIDEEGALSTFSCQDQEEYVSKVINYLKNKK